MSIDRFLENPPDRCYWCKRAMLIQLKEMAEREGLGPILHGLNKDELRDYRPGNRASQELGIRAPLLEAGLGKREIRAISKSMGLSVWNKPPSGCLATRVPYGQRITREKLAMVEQAEEFLLALGFEEVRVRHHGEMARVEVGQEAIYRLLTPGLRKDLVAHFRGLGFLYVALDIEGFVSGKMNRSLVKEDKEIEKK
ncbi:MAG TPA: ATP-dependent sacrificial sulfur transferase LarE [Desulfobacterales bacterium]|nr:ATP-dependent sacrificial sulfur transferase LarE [Desulfobacterales bacterium]